MTILSLAPSVIKAGSDLWAFINRIRETAKQSGEWSDEAEQAFQDKLDATADKPHWKPE